VAAASPSCVGPLVNPARSSLALPFPTFSLYLRAKSSGIPRVSPWVGDLIDQSDAQSSRATTFFPGRPPNSDFLGVAPGHPSPSDRTK
jgi:hypothetical protein